MNCVKCGRETRDGQVFCEHCLQIMEQHPIKPGTVVNLPRRAPASSSKKPRKRTIPPEEQIAALKRRSRSLTFWLVTTLLLLGLSLGALAFLLLPGQEEPDPQTPAVTSTFRYIP